MRNDLNVNMENEKSELKKWLLSNGRDTIEKFQEFQKQGFNKPLKFSATNADQFEAFIDPENKLSIKDKFSQVKNSNHKYHVIGGKNI